MNEEVIMENDLSRLGTEEGNRYIAHAYCHEGSCKVSFNDGVFDFEAGDCMIVTSNKLVEEVVPAEGFRCEVIYITPSFLEMSTPDNNYYIKGVMSLFLNPVMKLLPEEQEMCRSDFRDVRRRLEQISHHFRQEVLTSTIQTLFLDFYEFHARLYGYDNVPVQAASLLLRFLSMLENGTYRTHRDVAYYASELHIVPKYLSEISYKLSGFSANYWIKRFTVQEIKRLLRDKSLTIVQISDRLNFSSPSYFNRYVHKQLGVSPLDYRR